MRKIDSLRETLTATIEDIAKEPSRLRLWVDRGTVQSRQSATFGFAMAFRLNVLLMEMTTDIAAVGYVVCAWLRTHQPALLAPGQDAFALDIDVINNGTYDALLQIDLTQSVAVARDDQGNASVTYLPEPDPLFLDEQPLAAMPALALLKSVAMTGEGTLAPFDPAA